MSNTINDEEHMFVFPATKVFLLLMVITTLLTVLGFLAFLATQLSLENFWLVEIVESIMRLFDTDGEANIPSWYSSIALFGAAGLLSMIAMLERRLNGVFQKHWALLALVFLYLSVDEAALLHELANKPIRKVFATDGLLYYPWVVVAIALLFVMLLAYTKFLIALPSKTRWLFILAGLIFVGGAIFIESIGSYYYTLHGAGSLAYRIPVAFEEFCEMCGVAVFIYALMSHINSHYTIRYACTRKAS